MAASQDFGKLVLRLMLGTLLLFHGVHKVIHGIGPITAMVTAHHLPPALAYGVYSGEILGPVLLILGIFSRFGAALIVANMLFAVWLAGMTNLFAINAEGGYALELEMFFLFTALAIMFVGAGRYSLGGLNGRLN
ncbi:MAG TPA: DoxX family protein [Rhizomicrobium sp.]|nr:DoxX family protein [Rhizomicrobium sp.]